MSSSNEAPFSIVVADDSAAIRRDLATLLETIPGVHVVATVSDGATALGAIAVHKPDLLILDVRMPETGGLEVLRALQDRLGAPPVLMFTNMSGDVMRERALQAGAAGYYDKAAGLPDLLHDVSIRAQVPGCEVLQTTFGGMSAESVRLVDVVRDVTARAEAQSRIRFQASLLDAVGEAVIATDLDGRITYWNHAANLLYGWSAGEVEGRNVMEIMPSAATEQQAQEIMEALRRGEAWSGEFEVRRRDGSSFMAFVCNRPTFDEKGRLVGIVGTSSDISSRLQLEAELRQSQKMEAVGRLAGGVAHDFNNILTSISGFASFLVDGLAESDPLREDALEIRAAGERAAGLTRQLLAFSRRQAVQSRVFAVAPAVDGLENMLRRLIGEDVTLVVEADPDAGCVSGDVGLLEQVVLNLVVNSVDALPGCGEIGIRVAASDVTPGDATVPEGEYVRVTVSDTGCGISKDVLPHIFDPFFTTKPAGEGTGLGLSTVHGIVTQAGGFLHVESRPGRGTSVGMYLPRVPAEVAVQQPELAVPAAAAGGTILLVEDDDAVRRIAQRILQRHGYHVIGAETPSEALTALAAWGGPPIDLLLTDVILPEMCGPKLARQVQLLLPDIAVLLMSGYLPRDLSTKVEEELLNADTALLSKPFTAVTLLARVREVLGSCFSAAA